jgi:nicotinamidase-related amidase
MSTLTDRPNTALLVVDVQNGVVGEAFRRDEVVANVATLVDRARSGGVPVVWVQHSNPQAMPRGGEGWEIVPELTVDDGEPVVQKEYPDSFEDTDLEEQLAALAVGSLVVAGAQTDECIRSTLHGAIARGYDATLVSDAHTTEDLTEFGAPTPDLVIAHTNLYWANHQAPRRRAGTLTTADVSFGTSAGGPAVSA